MNYQDYLPSRPRLFLALGLLASALVLGLAALLYAGQARDLATGTALIGGPFQLTDQDGKPVTEKDFLGRHTLVAFGFTYCPDICPTELQVMTAALEQLGPKADDVVPVFVSVDPARDTPKALKDYLANFHPRFVGLTGTDAQVARIARAYRVYYAKVQNASDPVSYVMDHSSILYLMGPDGRFLKHFPYTTDAEALANQLGSALAR